MGTDSLPATLLSNPVSYMFSQVVHGPRDDGPNDVRNVGQQSFDDQSTGKVEEGHHPAPVEFSIRKDLAGHFDKYILARLQCCIIYHALKLGVAIKFISNLLQAASQFYVPSINQLSSTQLCSSHHSIAVTMATNSF